MVPNAETPEPEDAGELGADEATDKMLDTQYARDASLSGTTFARLTQGRSPVR